MRRKIFIAGLAAGLLAAALPGWSADRLVPSAYATIGAAMAAAQPGDRIVISGQHFENGQVFVSVNNLTITSGSPRADLRETRFYVNAQNVTFSGLDINGKSLAGDLSTTAQQLVLLEATSNNITFEDCKIVNPATGTGDGGAADVNEQQHSNPGSCLEVRTPGPLTIRDCDFVCDDYPDSQNVVNIHFRGAPNAVGPVLIENSDFAVERRCLDFQAGWSNITVRGCTFRTYGTGAGSSAGIYLFPDDVAPEAPITNLLIENCDFLGNEIGSRGVYAPSVRAENVVIRNSRFLSSNMQHAIRWVGRGQGPVIDNCLIEIGTRQGIGVRGSYAGNLFYQLGDPAQFLHGLTVVNCIIRNNDNAAIAHEWNVVDNIVIENNVFMDNGREAVGWFDMPASGIIRNNDMIRCGVSGLLSDTVNGGIVVAANDTLIAGNFLLDCVNGIIPRWSRGLAGDTQAPQTARHPNNLIIARNIVLRSKQAGIIDESLVPASSTDPQGAYRARSSHIRYINNTVANSVGFNMVVNGDNNQVYNNILVGGGGGLRDKGGSGNATFDKFGFNLRYNSDYENIPAGTIPTTDVVAFPMLAGGLFPTTRAGATPLPGSPALRAGSADGENPDYTTDIGAIQVGAVTDTAVPQARWELYR